MKMPRRKTCIRVILTILFLGGLYAASLYNFAVFLNLVSLFSIIIALGIFLLVWTSRHYLNNNYILFIGIAFLFIGSLQLAHTLSLQAIGSSSVSGSIGNTPEHLWLATRYLEGLTFLAAPLFIGRQIRPRPVFLSYTTVTIVMLATILAYNFSLVTSTTGGQLTPFTSINKYAITSIFICAALLLLQKRRDFTTDVLVRFITAFAITAGASMVTSLTRINNDSLHMIEHLAEIASLGLIFQAVLDTGLTRPYQLLLNDLSHSKETAQRERDSAQKYLDIAGAIILAINADGKVTLMNKRGREILDYEEKEIIGKDWFKNFLPPELEKECRDRFLKLQPEQAETTKYYEGSILNRNGEERLIAWHFTVLRDKSDNFAGILSSGEDITKRKQAENQLLESEARYRTLFETKLDGMLVIDKATRIVLANKGIADIFGFESVDEIYNVNLLDYIVPEHRDTAARLTTVDLFNNDEQQVYELRCTKRNGDEIWISAAGVLTEYEGKPAVILSCRDITDRKRMAETLTRSSQKYRSLFDNMSGGLIYCKLVLDENNQPVDAVLLEANRAIEKFTGLKREHVVGKRISGLVPGITETKQFGILGKVALTGEAARFEVFFQPTGKWLSCSAYSPEKGYYTAICEDITERKQAEEIFHTVSLGSPAGIYIVQDGRFIFANPRFLEDTGFTEDELLSTKSLDIVHPEDREAVRQNAVEMLKGNNSELYEYRIINKAGKTRWLVETVAPIQYQGKRATLGNVLDITNNNEEISSSGPVSASLDLAVYAHPSITN